MAAGTIHMVYLCQASNKSKTGLAQEILYFLKHLPMQSW